MKDEFLTTSEYDTTYVKFFCHSDTANRLNLCNTPISFEHYRRCILLTRLITVVSTLCPHLGFRMTSGYRRPEVNKAVGGVPNSRHLSACAFDFTVNDLSDAPFVLTLINKFLPHRFFKVYSDKKYAHVDFLATDIDNLADAFGIKQVSLL